MAVKPIFLKGLLNGGSLALQLNEINLNSGKWLICVKQVVFDNFKENIESKYFSISTNLVNDVQLVQSKKDFFNPPLAIFGLAENLTNFSKTFDQIWFEINNPHKTIELFFKSCFDEEELQLSSQVAVFVLLRKIC